MAEKVESKPRTSELLVAPSAEENWQNIKQTFVAKLRHLLDTGILSDVRFVVGKKGEKTFRVHRLILSMSSPEFFKMLNGSTPLPEEIFQPEVEPVAFQAVLKYIYTEEVDLNVETVISTLRAAREYGLPRLIQECEIFFVNNLSSKNAFKLMSQVMLFGQRHLKDICMHVIDFDAFRSFQAEDFTDIDNNLLSAVVWRDSLAIEEIDLFQAAQRWARAECQRQNLDPCASNKRGVLGGVLGRIRFSLMTKEDFCGVVESELLSDEERKSLETKFPTKPRDTITLTATLFSEVCTSSEELESASKVGNESDGKKFKDVMSFSTDRPVTLRGLGFYGSASSSTFTATVSIRRSLPNKSEELSDPVLPQIVFTYTLEASTPDKPAVFSAHFSKQIKINAGEKYTIITDVTSNEEAKCFVGKPACIKTITVEDPRGALEVKFYEPPYQGFISEMKFLL